MPPPGWMVTRRHFLHLLGATAAAACTPTSSVTSTFTGDNGAGSSLPAASTSTTLPPLTQGLPFSAWEELIAALRHSPDHLPARATRLVAEGNPVAIFGFVRDQIRVLPPDATGFRKAVSGRLWGGRATLRCGAGSPRDCADLLADLYLRAGFEAQVMEGDLLVPVEMDTLTAPKAERLFQPAADEAQFRRWYQALGLTEPGQRDDLDPDGEDSQRLAAALFEHLPADLTPDSVFDLAPVTRLPLVEVKVGDDTLYANPFPPGASFGEPYVERPVRALAGSTPGKLDVLLQVATARQPSQLINLAEASWPVEDLIGRQVVARFLPAGDLLAVLASDPVQLTTFIPILGVEGTDLTSDEKVALSTVGDAVTVYGDVLRAEEEAVTVNGDPVLPTELGASATVTSLSLSVSALSFPEVRLRLGMADGQGQPVWGVGAGEIEAEEDGNKLSFLLRASRPLPARILLLFDMSGSIPPEFVDEGAEQFAADLATRILAQHEDATFRLAGVLVGSASTSPRWLGTVEEVRNEARRIITDGSEMWSALADTRRGGANVIVLVTDAQATDTAEQIAAARPWVAAGPPVVVVGVGEVDQAIAADLAATSGGEAVPVTAPEEAVAAVERFLSKQGEAPYQLTYRAPLTGTETRQVSVRVGAAAATAEYSVPPSENRQAPPGLSGIYLTLDFGLRSVTRTLAGIPIEEAGLETPVPPELAAEVREALLGSALVVVEAEPPPFSVWADDFLSAKLSARALWEAPPADLAAQAAALEGLHHLPAVAHALQAPLPDPRVVAVGPRFLLLAGRHLPDQGFLTRADLLPLGGYSAIAPAGEGFRATVTATARLAVTERQLFSDSAALRLAGRPLLYLPPFTSASRQGPEAEHARLLDTYNRHHRLIPTDDGPFAFWAFDLQGSLLGILPDGSGGGATKDIGAQCQKISQVAAALQLAGGAHGFGYAVLVSFGKTVALQYLRAAVVVATLDPGQVPEACDKTAKDLACDIVKDTLGNYVKVYKPVDTVDDTVEMMGGELIQCFGL